MIFKERSKPYALLLLEMLDHRMTLPSEWRDKLRKRQTGYLGELDLDPHTAGLGDNFAVVNDVRLPTIDKSTHFQMDTLVIAANTVHIYEVKNHYGAYYVENGRFYYGKNNEVLDPSYQIQRAGTYLRQHLKSLWMPFEVETHLVFINPTFMLHQAPRDFSFLLRGQLESHFQLLQQRQQPYRRQQTTLAQYVTESHLFRIKNEDVPEFSYHDLHKGIVCAVCGSLQVRLQAYSCICQKCGHREKTSLALRRSIEEFRLFFPDRKITHTEIHKWCAGPTHRQVRRVLHKHYTQIGNTRATYYL